LTSTKQTRIIQFPAPPTFRELAQLSKRLDENTKKRYFELSDQLENEWKTIESRSKELATLSFHPDVIKSSSLLFARLVKAVGKGFFDLGKSYYDRIIFGKAKASSDEVLLRNLKQFVKSGGPSFVKLGQFISTAKGLLPDNFVDAFSWCRDQVPPMPISKIEEIIYRELGSSPDKLFKTFDRTPLAAASIAQTHRAETWDGRKVVMKVQRPHLYERFLNDLRAFSLYAQLANRSKTLRIANLPGFVELFSKLVLQELDFRLEALNMIEIGLTAEATEITFVHFPQPLLDMTTKHLLVMEFVPGVSYTNLDWTKLSDDDKHKLLRFVITAILEHTLVFGLFHGDLHAGNVLANEDSTLSLVDYGIVGRLSLDERNALIEFMLAFATNDTFGQLKAMQKFGAVPKECDIRDLARKLDEEIPTPESVTQESLGKVLGAVIRLLAAEGFSLPSSLVLFFKNLLYLNGFSAVVAPNLDLLQEIEPIFNYFNTKYQEYLG
jgi:ubiquinone biosynthesis protein